MAVKLETFEALVSDRGETEIYARNASELGTFAWLYINDHFPRHTASRGNLRFRDVDEVKRAIAALTSLLPAVDQLGQLT